MFNLFFFPSYFRSEPSLPFVSAIKQEQPTFTATPHKKVYIYIYIYAVFILLDKIMYIKYSNLYLGLFLIFLDLQHCIQMFETYIQKKKKKKKTPTLFCLVGQLHNQLSEFSICRSTRSLKPQLIYFICSANILFGSLIDISHDHA